MNPISELLITSSGLSVWRDGRTGLVLMLASESAFFGHLVMIGAGASRGFSPQLPISQTSGVAPTYLHCSGSLGTIVTVLVIRDNPHALTLKVPTVTRICLAFVGTVVYVI